MSAEIQDAVTLAADLQRTPVQQAAKRVWDALEDVDRHLFDLDRIAKSPPELNGVQSRLEAVYSKIALLMHEDDCE